MKQQPGYQQRERAHFDQLARESGEIWWGTATAAGWQRLRRRARMATDEFCMLDSPRVLEVGCGAGAFSRALLALTPELRLLGCDISPASLELARQRCSEFVRAEFVEADALDLPFEAGSFDVVVGNSILHHLPARSTLQQCLEVLRPGGVLWLSEPNMLNPQIAVEKNVRFIGRLLQNTADETAFFRWSIARVLRRLGFDDVSVAPFDFLHPLVPAPLVEVAERVGRICERLPVVREIAGSLVIRASAPAVR